MLNLLAIEPGQLLRPKGGSTAEVLENPGEGIWLKARVAGEDDLVFCEDIAGLQDLEQA